MGNEIGIIDLGSNTARLVIYHRDDQGFFYEVDNIKRVLRLSSHLSDGQIDHDGIEKAVLCMHQFRKLLDARQVRTAFGVATAAVRQALNGADLLQRIEAETGIPMEVLSGEVEARYGYLAVVHSMNLDEGITVDIGGGSTEVTYFANRQLQGSVSFPFGIVTLTHMFIKQDPPAPEEIAQLQSFVTRHLVAQPWLIGKRCPVIAIGGTARNLAKIFQKDIEYSLSSLHHFVMPTTNVTEIFNNLIRLPLDKRKQIPGLSKDRADVIIPGVAVFHGLLECVGSEQLLISDKGLRDGVLLAKMSPHLPIPGTEEVRQRSTERFMNRYRVERAHAYHVRELAHRLVEELERLEVFRFTPEEKSLLETAALLHDVGRSVNVYETSKHTFYLLTNVLLEGFTHQERLLIAMMASYKNSKQLQKQLGLHADIVPKTAKSRLDKLGTLLLLARALDRSMTQQIESIRLAEQKQTILLECVSAHQQLIEFSILEEELEKAAKAFKRPFRFTRVSPESFK